MTRPRRRAVFRVYGEDEYLAGVDTLADWEDVAPAGEPTHGRRLQRLAGAAALTGAVGTVGGVVGLAGLRTHAVDRREIAERIVSSARAAASRGQASAPAHVARRQILRPRPSRRVHAHRGTPVRVSRGQASPVAASARAIGVSALPSTPTRRSGIDEISDPPASAAQESPAAVPDVRPRAQSEFGFER